MEVLLMKKIGELYQSADWKNEKHVPVIHMPETAKAGDEVNVKVVVGEEIKHPNELEHHIAWIKVYFQPEGHKFPIELGTFNFSAHGESDVFTDPKGSLNFKAEKSGTVFVTSYCNIHGLWENSAELKVQ
jgi:superoxide reductase